MPKTGKTTTCWSCRKRIPASNARPYAGVRGAHLCQSCNRELNRGRGGDKFDESMEQMEDAEESYIQ